MRLMVMPMVVLSFSFCSGQEKDNYEIKRNLMVENQIVSRGVTNPDIIKAFKVVPRHKFIPSDYWDEAYDDHPLPIGFEQTISQPFVVAYMTEAVKASRGKKGLEIGTGSGYQAAILSEIIDSVFTIEIVPELALRSSELLEKLGYSNVRVKQGDGYQGWREHSPFDLIIVTAACNHIPQPLVDQLKEGGLLVIPVGEENEVQQLVLIEKKKGKTERKVLSYVRFVPFTRDKK